MENPFYLSNGKWLGKTVKNLFSHENGAMMMMKKKKNTSVTTAKRRTDGVVF